MDPLAILQRLGRGTVIPDLAEAISKASDEVVATGKPATVSLSLKITTQSVGDPMVRIEETIARSSPKKDAKGAFFFAVEGELHRDDPRQLELDLRSVDGGVGTARAVDARAAVREVAP